jgi:hypothetical protein
MLVKLQITPDRFSMRTICYFDFDEAAGELEFTPTDEEEVFCLYLNDQSKLVGYSSYELLSIEILSDSLQPICKLTEGTKQE